MTILRPALAAAIGLAVLAAPATAQELYGTLKKVRDTKAITIGYREASIPFSYYDSQKKPYGFAVELCLRVIGEVKKELKMADIEIKYVPVNSQTRIPLVSNGTVDIYCGQSTNTLARQQQVEFSYAYYITGERILTTKASGIKEWEDLDGKTVAIVHGALGDPIIKRFMEETKAKVRIVYVPDNAEGVLALETGRVDAFNNVDVVLYSLKAKSSQKDRLEIVGKPRSLESFGLMMRRDDSAFRLIVNRTLAHLYRSGEVYELFKKHFEPYGIPLTPDVEANFRLNSLPD